MVAAARRLSVVGGESETNKGGRPLRSPTAPLPSDEPGSSWLGQDSKDRYDRREFYVNSTDDRTTRESTVCKVRFPSSVVAEGAKLIASGALAGTPIDGWSALVRDAVIHRLHDLAQLVNDPHLTEALNDMRRQAVIDGIVREQEQKKKLIEDARKAFGNGQSSDDVVFVRVLVERYVEVLESLRDPYAKQLQKLIVDAQEWLARK